MPIAAYGIVCFPDVQTLVGCHSIIGNLRRGAKQAGSFPGLRGLRGEDDGVPYFRLAAKINVSRSRARPKR